MQIYEYGKIRFHPIFFDGQMTKERERDKEFTFVWKNSIKSITNIVVLKKSQNAVFKILRMNSEFSNSENAKYSPILRNLSACEQIA